MEDAAVTKDNQNYPAYRLSDIIGRLPAAARSKYRALGSLIEDQRALIDATNERRRSTEELIFSMEARFARLDRRTDAEAIVELRAEMDGLRSEVERSDKERARRSGIMGNCQQVKSAIEAWLGKWDTTDIGISGPIVAASVDAALQPGEDISAAIKRVRSDIARLKSEIATIKAAPLPVEDIRAAIVKQIDTLANQGRPVMNFEAGKVAITFADMPMFGAGGVLSAPPGSATKLMAWMFRDQLIEAMTAGLGAVTGGLAKPERDRRIAELERALLATEHIEEAYVCQAIAAGLEVHRRLGVNILALLGLTIAEVSPAADTPPIEPPPEDLAIPPPLRRASA